MKIKFLHLALAAAVLLTASCKKNVEPDQPHWKDDDDPEQVDPTQYAKPADAKYKVVAHRGGSSEAGSASPDNSVSALRYAMSLGCYGSECDIYWTKDDKIVIAHADSDCKINGMYPWEKTLEELRKGGKLKNGETLPSLEEFLDVVMSKGSCTRLVLDIKMITSPSNLTQYPINACKRACEIVTEKKAANFVEFICTGNSTVMASSNIYAKKAGIPIAWMSNSAASTYGTNGYTWANLSAASYMYKPSTGTGARTIKEFTDKGIALSIFNVDSKSGDSNAVYLDEDVNYYITNYSKLRNICTNYPKWLIGRLTEAGF